MSKYTILKYFIAFLFCFSMGSVNNSFGQALPKKTTTKKVPKKSTPKKNTTKNVKNSTIISAPELTVNGKSEPVKLHFNELGGEQTISISASDITPTITNLPYWVSIKNQNYYYITIICSENQSNNTRSATFYINANNSSIPVNITQDKRSKPIITNVQFANFDKDNNLIDFAGSKLYANKIRYLIPKLSYTGLDESKILNCDIKYYDPNGTLVSTNNVPSEYSLSSSILFMRGTSDSYAGGIGNPNGSTFQPGEWKFELYVNGEKLYSSYFTIYPSLSNTDTPKSNSYITFLDPQKPESYKTYPSKNFYLDLGGSLFCNPWSFGYNIGIGFNIDWFNLQLCTASLGMLHMQHSPDYYGADISPCGIEFLAGVNGAGMDDLRYKWTPQIGGVYYNTKKYDGLCHWGMAAGIRYDVLLCKHISFYINPKIYFIKGTQGILNFGFSFYL